MMEAQKTLKAREKLTEALSRRLEMEEFANPGHLSSHTPTSLSQRITRKKDSGQISVEIQVAQRRFGVIHPIPKSNGNTVMKLVEITSKVCGEQMEMNTEDFRILLEQEDSVKHGNLNPLMSILDLPTNSLILA